MPNRDFQVRNLWLIVVQTARQKMPTEGTAVVPETSETDYWERLKLGST